MVKPFNLLLKLSKLQEFYLRQTRQLNHDLLQSIIEFNHYLIKDKLV